MKKLCLTGVMVVLAMVFMFGIASAELISMDWNVDGDNNITYDSDTGLEWLDVSVTLGISTGEMLADFQSGGEFEGFRYATVSDLGLLTSALGIVSPGSFASPGNVAGARLMHGLFGGVYTYVGHYWRTETVYGYIVNDSTGQVRRQEYGLKYMYGNPPSYAYVVTAGSINCDGDNIIGHFWGPGNFQSDIIGHFIVKGTVVKPTEVIIDIKPGGCPNPLNVTDNGKLPVAVLGTEDFDVTDIDFMSIRLEGVAPMRSSIEDVSQPLNVETCVDYGGDGYNDLSLKFDNQAIAATLGENIQDRDEVIITLTGILMDGTEIEGSNIILVIKN